VIANAKVHEDRERAPNSGATLANPRRTAKRSEKMEDRLAQPMAVHVVGVKIPFLELVVLLVKLALAMIPALFIIAAVSALFWGVLGGLFGHHVQATNM
jgi:hypothetical protein